MPDTAGQGELWIRASRVRESCDLTLDVMASPPGWRVVIRPRKTKGEVEGVADHLVQALRNAMDRAEALGFVRAHP